VGKFIFISSTILIAEKNPHLLSTEFKGTPCVDKKLFVSLCVYQLGPAMIGISLEIHFN